MALKQALGSRTLVERLGIEQKTVDRGQRFTISGDDSSQTLMWRSLMKDCAFYYDIPSIHNENEMRSKL